MGFIFCADVLVEYTLSNLIHNVIDDVICSVESFRLVHVRELDFVQLSCMQLEVVQIFHVRLIGPLHTYRLLPSVVEGGLAHHLVIAGLRVCSVSPVRLMIALSRWSS